MFLIHLFPVLLHTQVQLQCLSLPILLLAPKMFGLIMPQFPQELHEHFSNCTKLHGNVQMQGNKSKPACLIYSGKCLIFFNFQLTALDFACFSPLVLTCLFQLFFFSSLEWIQAQDYFFSLHNTLAIPNHASWSETSF